MMNPDYRDVFVRVVCNSEGVLVYQPYLRQPRDCGLGWSTVEINGHGLTSAEIKAAAVERVKAKLKRGGAVPIDRPFERTRKNS